MKSSDYSERVFEEGVNFAGTIFEEEEADFTNATFEEAANFMGAVFKEKADFTNVMFKRMPIFIHTKFSRIPDFLGVRFAYGTDEGFLSEKDDDLITVASLATSLIGTGLSLYQVLKASDHSEEEIVNARNKTSNQDEKFIDDLPDDAQKSLQDFVEAYESDR